MADGRRNNGGHSTKGRAGRPSKAKELKLAEKIDNLIDYQDLFQDLIYIAQDSKHRDRLKAIDMILSYRLGKPTQRVESEVKLETKGLPDWVNESKPELS